MKKTLGFTLAIIKGKEARKAGVPREQNPYKPISVGASPFAEAWEKRWFEGWDAEDTAIKNELKPLK